MNPKELERFHGSNPDGTVFDMRETPHGDWAVFILFPDNHRIERYCSERKAAIDLLTKYSVIVN